MGDLVPVWLNIGFVFYFFLMGISEGLMTCKGRGHGDSGNTSRQPHDFLMGFPVQFSHEIGTNFSTIIIRELQYLFAQFSGAIKEIHGSGPLYVNIAFTPSQES